MLAKLFGICGRGWIIELTRHVAHPLYIGVKGILEPLACRGLIYVMKGLPTTLTLELARSIASAMERGLSMQEAAQLHSVPVKTLDSWKAKGEMELDRMAGEGGEPQAGYEAYAVLADAMTKAVPVRIHLLVNRIMEAGKRNWLADAWLLERMHPDRFGRVDRLKQEDVTPPENKAAQIIITLPANGRETNESKAVSDES